jgi:hypothetical protein
MSDLQMSLPQSIRFKILLTRNCKKEEERKTIRIKTTTCRLGVPHQALIEAESSPERRRPVSLSSAKLAQPPDCSLPHAAATRGCDRTTYHRSSRDVSPSRSLKFNNSTVATCTAPWIYPWRRRCTCSSAKSTHHREHASTRIFRFDVHTCTTTAGQ